MKAPSRPQRATDLPCHKPGGFILILVLVLVALVTILMVVVSITARIERHASYNAARIELARQNALFALNVAMGQLQREAGPDQRVTARADILSGTTGATIAQPYWTGVWKSYNPQSSSAVYQNLDVDTSGNASASALRPWSTGTGAGMSNQAANTNMVWLISGGTNNATVNPALFTGSSHAVALASNLAVGGTSASGGMTSIYAPLVAMVSGTSGVSGTTGQYAYWVSDEGVKAKATISDPTLSTAGLSYVQNQSHFLASQANTMQMALPVASGSDMRSDPSVAQVTTCQSLAFLPSLYGRGNLLSGSGAGVYSPDVTTYSWGVLSDVRHGGLKRDLTAAFETDASLNPSGNYQELLACGGGGENGDSVYRESDPTAAVPSQTVAAFSGSTVLDGLRWQSLYDYYNLYKTKAPMWRSPAGTASPHSGIATSALGLTSTSYALSQRMTGYNDPGGGFIPMDPVAPIVLEARVDIGLCSFVDPTTSNYRLRLRYYPTLVLYNPYGVRITSTQNPSYSYYTNLVGTLANVTVSGTSILLSTGTNPNALVQGSGYPLQLVAKPADASSFDPGEIKVFGLPADAAYANLGDPSSTNVCNLQLLTSTDANLTADHAQTYNIPWAGTTDPNAKVTVSLTGMTMKANVDYEGGAFVNEFPDGTANGASNQRFQSMAFLSATATGSWPSPSPAISTMTGYGYILVGFNWRSKGINASASQNYENWNYAVPAFLGNNVSFSALSGGSYKEVFTRALVSYASLNPVQMDNPGSGQAHHTSWGSQSVGDAVPTPINSRIVTEDVPCQPMFSLGQFSQLCSFYYNTSGAYGSLTFGSMFVGGSFGSPDIPLNHNASPTNSATSLGGSEVTFDNSFMANQALFDQYYFSTVPAATQPSADTSKYIMTSGSLGAAIQNNRPLPSNRMRFYYKNGVVPNSSASISAYESNLRDFQNAASCLMINGAFNVNSTSVAAWASLLSSLSGNSLAVWNFPANSSFSYSASKLLNPIPRYWNLTDQGTVNTAWEGMRALTNAQVLQLATQIVQQVKARGPFLSMGDFLNRRLGSTASTMTQMGALQAAIENTNPDINLSIETSGTVAGLSSAITTNASSLPANLNTAAGIPGYLMQQDLVQAFAPALTARSDTFVVRCYGEADNHATGAPEGKAWCEAVVQRVPDYIDQTDSGLTNQNAYGTNLGDATPAYDLISNPVSPTAILGPTNLNFGRRFKVVSFRWLNQTDL